MTSKFNLRMTSSEIAMGRYMRAPDHPPADEFATAFDTLVIEDRGGEPPAKEISDASAAGATVDEGSGDGAADSGGSTDNAAADAAAGDAAQDGSGVATPSGDAQAGEGGDAAVAAAEGTGAEPAAPAEAAAQAGADDADAILRRLAEHVKASEPPAAEASAAGEAEQPLYTQAEIDTLTKFQEDWGEVHTALELRERAFGRSILKYAFQEIAKVLEPIHSTVDGLAGRAHLGDIKDRVGEYSNDERQACLDWVDAQPDYLQIAYKGVIEEGTSEQVADLISRFREATGRPAPAAAPAPSQEPPKDTELSGKAKQAAKALAPVRSERSVVAEPEDQSNFDQAWDRWSKAENAG